MGLEISKHVLQGGRRYEQVLGQKAGSVQRFYLLQENKGVTRYLARRCKRRERRKGGVSKYWIRGEEVLAGVDRGHRRC